MHVLAHNELHCKQALEKKLKFIPIQNGIPDLEGVRLAIIGVGKSKRC
jgi:formiminoglutamase